MLIIVALHLLASRPGAGQRLQMGLTALQTSDLDSQRRHKQHSVGLCRRTFGCVAVDGLALLADPSAA